MSRVIRMALSHRLIDETRKGNDLLVAQRLRGLPERLPAFVHLRRNRRVKLTSEMRVLRLERPQLLTLPDDGAEVGGYGTAEVVDAGLRDACAERLIIKTICITQLYHWVLTSL